MKLLALLALAGIMSASAQPPTPSVIFNWVAPTANTDGTPLTGPLTFNIYQTPCGASSGGTRVGGGLVGTNWTYTSAILVPGTYCFNITAIVANVESAYSAQVSKTFATPPPTPNAPTQFTAQ